ncbi:MAG: hypothetical protein IPK35_20730 [Saprospiraceae bacterium]|jgi:hypothetical protein|nr:hypothetical protein [Saprospiraceae bacterium]
MNLTPDILKEISEQLDCGFRAFIHKTSLELIFIPDTNDLPDIDMDAWEEETELLDNNFTEYHEIDKWDTSDAFDMMLEFTEGLDDNEKLQNSLLEALRKRKPFREFKFFIDNSGVYRQKWFDFKNQWQIDYVDAYFKRLTSL